MVSSQLDYRSKAAHLKRKTDQAENLRKMRPGLFPAAGKVLWMEEQMAGLSFKLTANSFMSSLIYTFQNQGVVLERPLRNLATSNKNPRM